MLRLNMHIFINLEIVPKKRNIFEKMESGIRKLQLFYRIIFLIN